MNNKGSALILVIIAMCFIGILAALILWLAYMNYFMKAVNMRATDTFYTVDMVVEEMRAGLENDTAAIADDAYSTVLQRYAELDTAGRKSYYNTKLITDLLTKFEDPSAANNYQSNLFADYIQDATVKSNTVVSTGTNPAGGSIAPRLTYDYNEGVMVFHDVDVKYTNPRGYVAVIHTDFRIQAPNLDFSDSPSSDKFFSYGLIANKQLVLNNDLTLDLCNAYAGGREADATTNPTTYKDIDTGVSVLVNSGKTLNLSGTPAVGMAVDKNLVSRKTIELGTDAKFNKAQGINLWSENIKLAGNGSALDLQAGDTFVSDDLTIDGNKTTVKLAGSYYGFGTDDMYTSSKYSNTTLLEEDTTGDDSSAILVNGRFSSIDMSGLNNLWLMGRSYVGTRKKAQSNKINIPMSESVSIRGDQVAYLVPSQCLARWTGTAHDSWTARNPMTLAEYESHIAAYNNATYPNFTECDLTVELDDIGASLKSFGANVTYQTVFIQSAGLVYYYVVMDGNDANKYFQKYYSVDSNKSTISKYANKYIKQIVDVPDTATVNIAGNWLSAVQAVGSSNNMDDGNNVELKLSQPKSQPLADLSTQLSGYVNNFECLRSKLIDDNVSTVEKANSAYENLIEDGVLSTFCGTDGVKTFVYSDASTGEEYHGIATTKANYTYDGSDDKIRLIISTGNITIDYTTFEGCAIARGDIIISKNTTIKNDSDTKSAIELVLNSSLSNGVGSEIYAYQFFKNGSSYAGTVTSGGDSNVTIGDMVSYENWTKNGIN